MVLATHFQKQNSGKVNNCWCTVNLNCRQRRKLSRSISILLEVKVSTIHEGKKRHNKFMLHLRASSFSHQLQPLVKLRVRTHVLHILNRQHYRWNFKEVHASVILWDKNQKEIYSAVTTHPALNAVTLISVFRFNKQTFDRLGIFTFSVTGLNVLV
jgi:hypothetical protein